MDPVSRIVRLLPGELGNLPLSDPRLIVELTVAPNQEIEIVELTTVHPLNLNRKILVSLPENTRKDGIKIKSIQFVSSESVVDEEDCFIMIETNGPMVPHLKQVIGRLIRIMVNFGISNVFFPGNIFEAHEQEEASLFFFGPDINKLQRVSCGAEHIRILDEQFFLFCHKRRVIKKMRIIDAQCDWIVNSFGLWQTSEDILFIGRPKIDSIPITLQSGKVVEIDIWTGQEKDVSQPKETEKMAACVGEILGINIGITQQNQVILSPSF